MKPFLAVVLVLGLAACGKKGPTPPFEQPSYLAWKGSQGIRGLVGPSAGETVTTTVTVQFPHLRAKGPDDFVELCVNGQMLQKVRGKAGGGAVVIAPVTVTMMAGPGWLDIWDSTTDKNYRFQVDSRQSRDYVFTPTADGYTLTWSPREN